jgi:hypothetical protein
MNESEMTAIIFTDAQGMPRLYGANTFEHLSEHVTLEGALYQTRINEEQQT